MPKIYTLQSPTNPDKPDCCPSVSRRNSQTQFDPISTAKHTLYSRSASRCPVSHRPKRDLYELDVDGEPKMDNETISGRCRNIRKQLTDLLTALQNGSTQVSTTVTTSSIKDVVERFMLWAGNLGVLRKPASKLSLDSRLASSSDLRDYICTELDMSEAIEDLMNIVNGSMPNREIGYGSGSENDLDMGSDASSYSDDPVDEAGSILQGISQGIASLLKIGILVRQLASRGIDRFHRASRDSTSAFLDRFDIDYVQQKHPKLGSGEQSLRIGKAIAKRRQFIRYCRDHQSNLAAEEDEGKIGSQKATTAKQSSKATTFVGKKNLRDILQGSLEEDGDAVSHCSVSTTSESLAILKLPRLADLSPEDEPFECPICYTLQQFRSEQAWRRHAYRDLKAYVCTVGGTECDDKFFEDRTSWFNHKLEQHRCSYACVLCGVNDGQNKTTRRVLRRHILTAHGDFEPDQLERFEDAGRDTTKIFKANDCPFCDDWSELIAKKMPPGRIAKPGDDFIVSTSRFKKHVAMHLEQLAIFALPRHEQDTGMDEDGSHGSDPRVMDSQSSASFAGSFGSENERFDEEHQSDQAPSVGEGSTAQAGSETEEPQSLERVKQQQIEELELKLGVPLPGFKEVSWQKVYEMERTAKEEHQTLEKKAVHDRKEEEERQKKHAEQLAEAQKKARIEFEAALKAAEVEKRQREEEYVSVPAEHESLRLVREAAFRSKEEYLHGISADEQARNFISDYDLSKSLGSNHNEQTMPTGIPTFTDPVIPSNEPGLAQDEQESPGLESTEEHGQTHAGQTAGSLRHEGQQWPALAKFELEAIRRREEERRRGDEEEEHRREMEYEQIKSYEKFLRANEEINLLEREEAEERKQKELQEELELRSIQKQRWQ